MRNANKIPRNFFLGHAEIDQKSPLVPCVGSIVEVLRVGVAVPVDLAWLPVEDDLRNDFEHKAWWS